MARRGVALFEVILASILLAVGLTVALSLATNSVRLQGLGEHNMVAAWLADEQMNLVLMEGPVNYLSRHTTAGSYEPPFDAYRYEVKVDHTSDYAPYEVTVLIFWDENDRRFELTARIAPRQGEELKYEDRRPLEPIDREALYYEDDL